MGPFALTFEAEVRPIIKEGWWIQLLGTLSLTLALVPFGISLVRERILPAWLVPVLVFGAAATVFLTPAFVVPGIVWLLLGATLLRRRWSAARS